MYEILFENPLIVGLAGAIVTGLTLYGWIQTGNVLARNLGGAFALVTGLLVVLNLWVQTEREAVREWVLTVAKELQSNDIEGVKSRVHAEASERVNNALSLLPSLEVKSARITRIHSVDVRSISGREIAEVRMNVVMEAEMQNVAGKGARWVRIDLEKEDGKWLVIDFEDREPQHEFMKSRPY